MSWRSSPPKLRPLPAPRRKGFSRAGSGRSIGLRPPPPAGEPNMSGKAIIIQPGDTSLRSVKIVDLEVTPELPFLSEAVEGPIEVVPYFDQLGQDRCVAFCNEEGKLQYREPNYLAHSLWELAVGRKITTDLLVVPICIITGDHAFLEAL